MLFKRRDARQRAMVDMALKQVEKMLWDMAGEGKDLSRLKLRKYQKTHYTNCQCKQCREAARQNDPHRRGILEDGFKVYVGVGAPEGEE